MYSIVRDPTEMYTTPRTSPHSGNIIHAPEKAAPLDAIHASSSPPLPTTKEGRRQCSSPACDSISATARENSSARHCTPQRHDVQLNKFQFYLHTKNVNLIEPAYSTIYPLPSTIKYWSFEPECGSNIDMATQKKISLLLLRNLRGAQQQRLLR